jgi:hypothetical protein
MYKELEKEKALMFLPQIWTVFLSKDPNLFAEPFSNRRLRHRCLFEKSKDKITVYFYLNPEDIKFVDLESMTSSEKIYFYGAFNHINIFQVRAFGEVSKVVGEKKDQIINLMIKRLKGKKTNDPVSLKLERKEKSKTLISLKEKRTLYALTPDSYAYRVHEKG